MAETPRSLVLNLFGEYLRCDGGEVELTELTERTEGTEGTERTELMVAFAMSPATIRVSMSRLKKEDGSPLARGQGSGLRPE